MIPNLDNLSRIYALNSDDVMGRPTIWIVFESGDGSKTILSSKQELEAVGPWLAKNLPDVKSEFDRISKTAAFEDFLIYDLYVAAPE